MKLKRILGIVLAFALAFSTATVSFAGFNDVEDGAYWEDAAAILSGFGMICGDQNGNLRPYDTITRAEFATLAVGMINELDNAKTQSSPVSYFTDVYNSHWALPYINYVADKNIIVGYANGTFMPESNITYGEAITVVLRALKYDDSVISGFWPDSYVSKAAVLGVTDGIAPFDSNAPITRADAFVIIANALDTKLNGSNQVLMNTYSYSKAEDVIILATHIQDASVEKDSISTTAGNYKYTCDDPSEFVGQTVSLYIDDEGYVCAVAKKKYEKTQAVIKKVLGSDKYLCITEDGEKNIKFDSDFTVYTKSGKSSYKALSGQFSVGAKLSLYSKDSSDYYYAMLTDADDIEPVVAYRDYVKGDATIGGIEIKDIDNLTVYRDGFLSSVSNIKKYDVIYYNPVVNTMDVYIDKVTGLYEEAYPSKAYVTQIEVGGNIYELGTDTAIARLDESAGSFEIDDVVTLLLGKDGKVVDVCQKYSDTSLDYGVVTAANTSISTGGTNKGETVYTVTLIMGDKKTYTYETKESASSYEGKLVKVDFDDGYAKLSTFSTEEMYGYIDTDAMLFDSYPIAENVVIFNKTGESASSVEVVEKDDIDYSYIERGSVLGCVKSMGKIAVLYAKNITANNVKYGVLTGRQKSPNGIYTYTVVSDNKILEYSSDANYAATVGLPVKMSYQDTQLKHMQSMISIKSGSEWEYGYNNITLSGQNYKMDTNVLVYSKNKNGDYYTLSTSVLEDESAKSITLYADARIANGGIIRAIYVTLN